ncbi:MAG TPA: putative metallopeptidase [Actinophytocola sp.]|uniref:putative metallopeptidase n=1 Tax=Actinophytocola sp. TaxID=1872138 RepID=UPI002DDD9978|nr:putative metallopeptidase [Actinophytocola sp.]HEV2779102.1 putative metallopeptidase [Actinophytocola sp.]
MTTYWRAHEVEKIVEKLVPEHHEHLARTDVTIRCVFRDTAAKSRGWIVLGKARKVSGLAAHLVGLVRKDDLGDDPADFFVIEVPHEPWVNLTQEQRIALVDHELCHFWVALPDDPDEPRRLVILGHDLEEFKAIVERHGLWKPDVKSFAKAASQQLSIDDLEPGEVFNRIAPVDES